MFKKIYVDDTHQVGSELAEPFHTLFSKEVTAAAKVRAETIDHRWQEVAEAWSDEATGDLVAAGAQMRQGLSFETLVGLAGQNLNLRATLEEQSED